MKKSFIKKTTEEAPAEEKKSLLEKIPKKFALVGLIVIILVAAGGGYYFLNIRQSTIGPQAAAETKKVIDKVGKLIELPAEEPILATVTDVGKLPKEPFYQNAQDGDKVLVYKNAKIAILYRPAANKIIKVGAVTIEEQKTASRAGEAVAGTSDVVSEKEAEKTPTPTPGVVRVAIYNGTKTAGLAKKTGDSLEAKFQNIEVVSTANATGDHTKTLVVDLSADKAGLSGKNKNAASSLSKELGGEVGSLPEAETAPSGADILIILGQAQ